MTHQDFGTVPTGDPLAISRLHRWGGEKLVREMAGLFRREVPMRMAAARNAADRGDCVSTEQAAHSLKSSCGQLGAARMRNICEQLEKLAEQRRLDPVPALLDDLAEEFASFTAWLEQMTIASIGSGHE